MLRWYLWRFVATSAFMVVTVGVRRAAGILRPTVVTLATPIGMRAAVNMAARYEAPTYPAGWNRPSTRKAIAMGRSSRDSCKPNPTAKMIPAKIANSPYRSRKPTLNTQLFPEKA
ncbi:hypothetical protein CBQ26_16770 [Deinococcus indicus]|uniref:Uncharacterized protein n=1 Tax=Deinococcus indicus TaxID=223556 RepID=A0A246BG05_9DEIO|nr:hypothetical protein CBQ26_16770 [Deinococcus indicus]